MKLCTYRKELDSDCGLEKKFVSLSSQIWRDAFFILVTWFPRKYEIWDSYRPKLNANGTCNYAHTDCDLYKIIVFQRICFLNKPSMLLGFMEKTAVIAHFSSDKLQNKHWLLLLIISKIHQIISIYDSKLWQLIVNTKTTLKPKQTNKIPCQQSAMISSRQTFIFLLFFSSKSKYL